MSSKKILPVVHLVDTEGPLDESLEETFRKLKALYQIDLAPSQENLERVQRGESVPDEFKEEVMRRYSKHRLNHNRNWTDVGRMCETLFSSEFRARFPDSLGNPYLFNWCCPDFLGFEENPRKREMRPNVIFQHFEKWIQKSGTTQDRLFWHYHPVAFSKAAHRSGTSLNHSPFHYQSLAHRILDCHHFPSVYRPGYHMERVDLNLFLEQWIPFDYANQNVEGRQHSANYGRIQNWDGAPTDWSVYHPSFHDPRKSGELKRTIARTLNIGTDFSILTENEVEAAFESCLAGKPAILSFTDHDFRDMTAEVAEAHAMIQSVHRRYKDRVDFQYCNGVAAMRMALRITDTRPVEITAKLKDNRLDVELNGEFFGAQPFLALRSRDGGLYHDNFCLTQNPNQFFYVFDEDSLPLGELAEAGVAINARNGSTTVVICRPGQEAVQQFQYRY